MSFRILNQAPQYLLADGSVNAGGKLAFYETDLTTPKNTWSDEGLTVLNSNPVIMDAAGRTLTDVWGDDGEYGVVMLDQFDNVIWTRNNVRANDVAGTAIPALEVGKFLSNDGSQVLWDTVRQVPDPTGSAGRVLGTDGSLVFWEPKETVPTLPESGIGDTSSAIRVGEHLLQVGSGSLPATGTQQSTTSVTFPTPFNSAVGVNVVCQIGPSASMFAMIVVNSVSATGFSVSIDTNLIGANIVAPQGFTYHVYGPVDAP